MCLVVFVSVVYHGDVLSLAAHHPEARSIAIQDGSEGLPVHVIRGLSEVEARSARKWCPLTQTLPD